MSAPRDGYVFRTDLRLRPDPALDAAGDLRRGGASLLRNARPELGARGADQGAARSPATARRRAVSAPADALHLAQASRLRGDPGHPLDQAADQRASSGGGAIALAGHDIKIGRGGIREIEFFAQTQQLIWGGRDARAARRAGPAARCAALAAAGRIDERRRRHADRRLPFPAPRRAPAADDRRRSRPTACRGSRRRCRRSRSSSAISDRRRLRQRACSATLRRVERHYAELFEEAPTSAGPGNLVFTGTDDDPETLETLDAARLRRRRARSRRRCAAGTTAATGRRAARARANS